MRSKSISLSLLTSKFSRARFYRRAIIGLVSTVPFCALLLETIHLYYRCNISVILRCKRLDHQHRFECSTPPKHPHVAHNVIFKMDDSDASASIKEIAGQLG